MGARQATYWEVFCDYPGCSEQLTDDMLSAWSDVEQALEAARDYEWLVTDEQVLCDAHRVHGIATA